MSKFQTISANVLAGIALTFCAVAADAAYITVDPMNSTVAPGATFDVAVVGRDFADGTIGGGFTISWDPALLQLDSYSLTFAGDQILGQLGVVDNVAGSLSNADVTSIFTVVDVPNFDIALLTFTSTGVAGTSALDLSIGLFDDGVNERVWADATGFFDTTPDFVDGSVNVIPVPAAVWLFGSGLLGLIGVARRRA